MKKRMVIMLIVVGLLLGGIFGFQAFKNVMIKKYLASASNPPQTVSAIKATERPWQPTIEAVGSLRARRGADLSLQVAGIVAGIHFKSGDEVEKGQKLLTLSADDDRAKLASLRVAEQIAHTTYERDKRQYKAEAISKQALDNDEAALKQAQANVAQQQAALNYKYLMAPFSGRLGLRQVDLGQYLNAGTVVVTLQQLDPIFVDFYLPQQDLSRVKAGQQVVARTDTYPDDHFDGKIIAINPTVDVNTRNVQVRAQLANPDEKLLTGMYATVDVQTGTPASYITLPQTAITYNPYGNTVYLLVPAPADKGDASPASSTKGAKASGDDQPTLVAQQQFVTTGETRGDQIQVLKGVKAGDLVVSAGQLKLHNGSPVKINNSIQPSNDAHPTPQEQ